MRAYIKKSKWNMFKEHCVSRYGFTQMEKPMFLYTKRIDKIMLLIIPITRELILTTPMGISPFMESHKNLYKELIMDDMVFYKEGKFD